MIINKPDYVDYNIFLYFTASEDVPTDVTELCSNLILSLSLDSKVTPLVGEVLAALSCEGIILYAN